MGTRQVIEKVRSLAGTDPRILDRLAEAATVRSHDRGDRLWHAGDTPEALCVIKSGLVKVVRLVPGGRAAICGIFGPHETVGELAVLRGVPYPADAIVATDYASTIAIPASLFTKAVALEPALAVGLACSMHSKLMQLHDKVDVLSAGAVEARLATLFVKLYDRFGDDFEDGTSAIPLALARRELAELTSTTFETVIRIMSRWARDGVLDTTPNGFVIRRLDVIREMGDGRFDVAACQNETGTSI